jgi:hypothetical protein
MAKIKFGMMMTDASGKLGGQVFSKNRGGSYVRTKVTPTNPQTTAQMLIRGIFASISSAWSSLTEAQRNSWNGFVQDYARTDVFGDLRNPSGKALFQRLNQNLEVSEQAQLLVCPSPAEVPFANLTSASADVSDASFDVDYAGNTTGSKVVVWATPSMSQGTKFIKNKLRKLDVFVGANAGTLNIQAAYVARFGAPVAGANIYVGVKVINVNGQASPIEIVKATVVA